MDPPIDPIDYRYRMKEKKPIVCCFCPMRPCVLAILLVLIPLLFVALYLSIYESQYIYVIVSSGCPASLCSKAMVSNGKVVEMPSLNQKLAVSKDHDGDDVPKGNGSNGGCVELESMVVPEHKTEKSLHTGRETKLEIEIGDERPDQPKTLIDSIILSFYDMTNYYKVFLEQYRNESNNAQDEGTDEGDEGKLETAAQEGTPLNKNIKYNLDETVKKSKTVKKDLIPEFVYDSNKDVDVDAEDWTFNIPNSGACPEKGKPLKLIIGIYSSPRNFEIRDAIRDTWASIAYLGGYSYVFIIGFDLSNEFANRIKHESDANGDIVQTNLLGRKDTETEHSVIFMKWLKEECPLVEFAMKTKDDVFVNLPLVAYEIAKRNAKERAMYGFLTKSNYSYENAKEKVEQLEDGTKIKELKHETTSVVPVISNRNSDISGPLSSTTPDYLSAEGYIFPGFLAAELYKEGMKTRASLMKEENVFITGVLADRLKIPRKDIPWFSATRPDIPSKNQCEVLGYAMTVHPVTAKDMRGLWKQLKDSNFNCGNFNYYALKMYPEKELLYTRSFANARILPQPEPAKILPPSEPAKILPPSEPVKIVTPSEPAKVISQPEPAKVVPEPEPAKGIPEPVVENKF